MKRPLIALGLAVATASAAAAAELAILPFRDVRPGMKGIGKTVFEGTEVRSFDVEILGTLPRIAPGQDLILGRCAGGPLDRTGVLAGMSGSPVFVDGRLVGAIAYNWGFSKEAIAGITPIEEMLEVGSREPRIRERAGEAIDPDALTRLRSPESLASFFSDRLPAMLADRAPLTAAIPLSVSGVGAAGLTRIAPDFARLGWLATPGGGAGAAAQPSPALEPGSAVGLKLVRGDVDIAATGTVTWIEGDRVLAFGHPLFGLGTVAFPLTGARVEALLPSLDRSMRLATPLSEVGAFLQDRRAAVAGRLGPSPRMIPVRLQLAIRGRGPKSFSFDVAEDPLLAPLLLYHSLNAILASTERVLGNITLRLGEGSVIKLEDHEDVELRNVFAGSQAPSFATATSAFILYVLLNNDLTPPRVAGVNLRLEYDEEPRTASLRRVSVDRYRVRAGETIRARIVLSPFRGPDQVLTREIVLPPETAPGPLVLTVGNALAVSRAEGGESPPLPRDLAQLIGLINQIPRNDRVYIVASREDSGVFLGGARLSNLPPSVTTILTRPRNRGNFAAIARRAVLEEEIPVEWVVEGLARVQIEVETP